MRKQSSKKKTNRRPVLKQELENADKCPVCSSTKTLDWYSADIDFTQLTFTYEFSPVSQKTFRVVRCKNCTHVFCSPLPKDVYKNYEDVIDNEYLRHAQTRILTSSTVLESLKQYVSKGRLLDIGCATGDFLTEAKKQGYLVEGLELSHWSAEIARKKGLKIFESRIASLEQKLSSRYDIITLWGVIEHFEDPLREMRYINKFLKPGGIIAVWTGDVDGIMSRILRRRWWYWQGQHIQYFSHESLNHIGLRSGFREITTARYPLATNYEQIDNSLSRYIFKPHIDWLVKLMFAVKPIWTLRLPGEMLWIARKTTRRVVNSRIMERV